MHRSASAPRLLSLLMAVVMIATATVASSAPNAAAQIDQREHQRDQPALRGDAEVRVVGGDDADAGEYPFMAALQHIVPGGLSFQCGATLIDPMWVMTAAHCVDDVGADELGFLIGALDRRVSSQGEQRFAQRTVLHPNYSDGGFGHDIALVQLTEPSTRPTVTLADATNAASWQNAATAIATGWGDTRSLPRFPGILQEVDLPLVTDADCAETQVGSRLEANVMTCAGTTGVDTCGGDSGGPLLVTTASGFVQIGLSSFGSFDCAEADFPGVYTEVPFFAEWIQEVIAPPIGQPVEVSHVVSCLAGNARVDTNTVNTTGAPATYRMQFGSLTPRQWTSDPDDWFRAPVTGRPDGSHEIVMRRNGEIISRMFVRTECDTDTPIGSPHEVAIINGCRGGNGYLLFQFVNPTAASRGYLIEFDGVPNRSTSAAAFGASVRAVTGRGDGTWGATVSAAGSPVATFEITVDCDSA